MRQSLARVAALSSLTLTVACLTACSSREQRTTAMSAHLTDEVVVAREVVLVNTSSDGEVTTTSVGVHNFSPTAMQVAALVKCVGIEVHENGSLLAITIAGIAPHLPQEVGVYSARSVSVSSEGVLVAVESSQDSFGECEVKYEIISENPPRLRIYCQNVSCTNECVLEQDTTQEPVQFRCACPANP